MPATMRGQPLVVLCAVLVGWIGGRMVMNPLPSPLPSPLPFALLASDRSYVSGARASPGEGVFVASPGPQSTPFFASPDSQASDLAASAFARPAQEEGEEDPSGLARAQRGQAELLRLLLALLDYRGASGRAAAAYREAHRAADGARTNGTGGNWEGRGTGHDDREAGFYLAPASAGFDRRAAVMPAGFAPDPGAGMALGGREPAAQREPSPPVRRRRWSADAWALLREGEGGAAGAGPLPSTYGASQAGAVLRYALRTHGALRPQAYMRTTSAMGTISETSAALGVSARPLGGVPLRAGLEGRLTTGSGGQRVQGAALAISEIPPFEVAGGLRGEAYAQAGYVAGEFSTAFVDGQLRLDRSVVRHGAIEARLGGGVWGGAQKGAERFDAGPSAMVTAPLGRGAFGRLALDWRFRLAGGAVPDSGPAVTFSAGF